MEAAEAMDRARLLLEQAGKRRKRKKRRKKKLPRSGCTRRRRRQWHVRHAGCAGCDAPRDVVPLVDDWPLMLGIMASMDEQVSVFVVVMAVAYAWLVLLVSLLALCPVCTRMTRTQLRSCRFPRSSSSLSWRRGRFPWSRLFSRSRRLPSCSSTGWFMSLLCRSSEFHRCDSRESHSCSSLTIRSAPRRFRWSRSRRPPLRVWALHWWSSSLDQVVDVPAWLPTFGSSSTW